MPLHVTTWGEGERLLMVHGSFGWGEGTFVQQLSLASQYRLLVVDRCGYGESPVTDEFGFDSQSQEIAELLGEGAHLLGHSYGGVISLLAAAKRPEAVKSLTVIEPPAFKVARGKKPVEDLLRRVIPIFDKAEQFSPGEFYTGFLRALGIPIPTPLELSERDIKNIRATAREPRPWDAEIPLERLSQTKFPKLVVSGEWNTATPTGRESGKAFAAVCDVLQARLGTERAIFKNSMHNPQLTAPAEFNDRLRMFLASA